jgi:molybdopterin-binding protein
MQCGDARARGQLAGVFQRPILFTGSVQANLEFGLRALGIAGAERRRRAGAALEWLDLGDLAGRSVHTLSGGEAQRVALARAVVLEPLVVLLDEPTASLDVTARRAFRHDLERVARQHARGVVLITHDAAEAFGLADRIAVMQDGRIVQEGRPDEIVLEPATPFIAELTGAELLLHGTVVSVEENLAAIGVGSDPVIWSAVRETRPLRPGDAAVIAYRPEDVVLAAQGGGHDTSAVNRLPGRVEAVVPAGALVRVRVRTDHGLALTALVTRRSTESLGLAAGTAVTAQMKATALHAWAQQ